MDPTHPRGILESLRDHILAAMPIKAARLSYR